MNRDHDRKFGKAYAVASCIFSLIFILVWCGIAASMQAWFMLLFGIPGFCLMAYRTVLVLRQMNSSGQSDFSGTKSDFRSSGPAVSKDSGFCPYCGVRLDSQFRFCPSCGRKIS